VHRTRFWIQIACLIWIDLTMASAPPASTRRSRGSSVSADATKKAEESALQAALTLFDEHTSSNETKRAKRNFVSGILNSFNINKNWFYYELRKRRDLQNDSQVKPEFWRFFLSSDHVLRAVRPRQAKAKTLVRLAFKSFEMNLPFNDCAIDSKSERLPRSQKEKVDRLNQ
jgi:hypothetical protein